MIVFLVISLTSVQQLLSDKATDYIRRIMFNQEMNSDDTRLKVTQARLNLARADNDRLSRVLY